MALHLILLGHFPIIILPCFIVMAVSTSDPCSIENGTQNEVHNYIFPNSSYCISRGTLVQHPCLTLNDYVDNVDTYFVNDSSFIFIPGNHQLSVRLTIRAVHNISIKGLSENSVTIEIRNESGFFACNSCVNVSIANILFDVGGPFTCILLFVATNSVRLSNITIIGNSYIGCSSIISERSAIYISNSMFTGIRGFYGAVLIASRSVISFTGENSFVNNEAESGGAMYFDNNILVIFNGTSFFTKNCATGYLNSTNELSQECINYTVSRWILGNIPVRFYGNFAEGFGGSIFSIYSTIVLGGNVEFDGNFASKYGGAVTLSNSLAIVVGGLLLIYPSNLNSNSTMYGRILLLNNHANLSGGALYAIQSSIYLNVIRQSSEHFSCQGDYIMFLNNSAKNQGGAIFLTESNMQVCETTNITTSGSTTINLTKSTMQVCRSVSLVKNNVRIGGAIHTEASNISIGVNCSNTHILSTTIVFLQNTATYSGGSISSIDSHLYFMGSAQFDGNTAGYGGAMILDGTSIMMLMPNLTIHFMNNRANEKGGVFYYNLSVSSCDHFRQYYNLNPQCFVSFEEDVSLTFLNNSASNVGSLIYSGTISTKSCYLYSGESSILEGCTVKIRQSYCSDLHLLFANESTLNYTSLTEKLFFADAEYVKFCPLNSTSHKNVSVYPGEKFNVSLFAMGTFNLPVSTSIMHKMLPTDEKIELRRVDHPTKVNSSCTNVSYYLLLTENAYPPTVHIKIYHQNLCDSLVDGINIFIDIKPCPLGFQLSSGYEKCTCDKWLQNFGITNCDIDNLSIERNENTFWISKQPNGSGLILHYGSCPFGFCKDQSVNVTLTDPSIQCHLNRNGTLCGQCKKKYSLALGTLHCLNCFNDYSIALIIPFALAGIALVMVILLLRLTVDVGTLNGLIFYANIVHSNKEAYFQHTREIANFHAIFISWLNLDFGIEMCFYDGMDIYVYSWLQFLFPFYLWFLIGAITIFCRYSQRLSNSLGRNPVAALATVLFLSYGKVLNAIIAPLSKTKLLFSSNDGSSSTLSVWLYDGSVDYFAEPKHIALGLFAILILLLAFVPYTFILLCGHWLIAYSDKCYLLWLNKFKPILDVYYAPFKQETRYWIGLTLLSRSALLLTIAINSVGSDSVNLLVIASVTAGLLSIKGRVYTHRHSDIIETSFILNLCIFSIATFYLKERDIQNQLAILNASIGVTFVTFLGIIFFHIYLLLKSTRIWNVCVISMFCKSKWLCKVFGIVQKEDKNLVLKSNDPKVVTSTLVELREPLIDNDEV